MTLVGAILVTIVTSSTLFENNTMSHTELLLPSMASCTSAAQGIKDKVNGATAYCIPVYDNGESK